MSTHKLDLFRTNCDANYATVCQTLIFAPPYCLENQTVYFQNSLVTMFGRQPDMQLAITYIKAEIKDMMHRLNQVAAFKPIFSTLWYSSLPCFDIRCQFHQHFMSAFFANIFAPKNCKAKT